MIANAVAIYNPADVVRIPDVGEQLCDVIVIIRRGLAELVYGGHEIVTVCRIGCRRGYFKVTARRGKRYACRIAVAVVFVIGGLGRVAEGGFVVDVRVCTPKL
ncbi:MAG: hypothetical protein IKK70_06660 [Clostridia bacterium]|nr:hypothetical protein [Clostridia bacterium]